MAANVATDAATTRISPSKLSEQSHVSEPAASPWLSVLACRLPAMHEARVLLTSMAVGRRCLGHNELSGWTQGS
jgi:hypothetical protein